MATAGSDDSKTIRRVRHRLRGFLRAFAALRIVAAPLAVSSAAFVVLAVTPQFHDVYRADAEAFVLTLAGEKAAPGLGAASWTGAALTVFFVWLLAATLGAAARHAIGRLRSETAGPIAPARWFLRIAPTVAYALPGAGFLIGLWLAVEPATDASAAFRGALIAMEDWERVNALANVADALQGLDLALQVAAGAVAALMAAHGVWLWIATRRADLEEGPSLRGRRRRRWALGAALAAFFAALLLFPVALPQALGATPLLCLFFIAAAFIATELSIWSQRAGAPFIAFTLIVVALFSAFDLNDNHRIRLIGGSALEPAEPTLEEARSAFRKWYAERKDRRAFEEAGRPYPVYIVAAQGGGAYAATHTVQALRRLQAACGRFNQHLFAISAVSGGAVGAAFIGAMARSYSVNAEEIPCAPEPFEAAEPTVRLGAAIVGEDFLSPALAGLLFTDAAQRFLPVALPPLSRSRAFERALEAAWDAGHRDVGVIDARKPAINPMTEGVLASWDPKGAGPALIFNATEVGSGRRRVIAPFRFGESASDLQFFPIGEGRDVAISVAAGVSARFPWFAPAGWFRDKTAAGDSRKVRLVDGGYFENSGVATAIDLIRDLEADPDLPNVRFHLIALTWPGFPERSAYGVGEVLEPIRALLAVRSARSAVELDRAEAFLGRDGVAPRLKRMPVGDLATPLPLGWRLSATTRLQIALQSGDATRCRPTTRSVFERAAPRSLRADCVLRLVRHELAGDDLDATLKGLSD